METMHVLGVRIQSRPGLAPTVDVLIDDGGPRLQGGERLPVSVSSKGTETSLAVFAIAGPVAPGPVDIPPSCFCAAGTEVASVEAAVTRDIGLVAVTTTFSRSGPAPRRPSTRPPLGLELVSWGCTDGAMRVSEAMLVPELFMSRSAKKRSARYVGKRQAATSGPSVLLGAVLRRLERAK